MCNSSTRWTMHVRYYFVTRSRKHCCYGNAKIAPFLLLLAYMYVSATYKCSVSLWKCSKRFCSHSCRSTKYFIFHLTTISNKCMTSVFPYSCLSYYSSKLRLLCAVILLSSVACLALTYFSTLSDKAQDFRKKSIE